MLINITHLSDFIKSIYKNRLYIDKRPYLSEKAFDRMNPLPVRPEIPFAKKNENQARIFTKKDLHNPNYRYILCESNNKD